MHGACRSLPPCHAHARARKRSASCSGSVPTAVASAAPTTSCNADLDAANAWPAEPKLASSRRTPPRPRPGVSSRRNQASNSSASSTPLGRQLREGVAGEDRDVHRQDQRIGRTLEDAEHEEQAVLLVRQLQLGALAVDVGDAAFAGTPQRQHMPALDAVARAAIQRDDLVLAGAQPLAVDRQHAPGHRHVRVVWHEGVELALGQWRQAVADVDLHTHLLDRHGRRHHHRPAVVVGERHAGAQEVGGTDEARLVAEQVLRIDVVHRAWLAEQPERRVLAQVADDVGQLALRHRDMTLLRCDDARCQRQLVVLEDHRLGQEGADQVQRDRADRAVVQQVAAHARRDAHGVVRCTAAGLGHAQPGAVAAL